MLRSRTKKNPGQIIMMPDGRRGIVYNNQPLRREFHKILIHLVDEDHKQIMNGKKPAVLVNDEMKYAELMAGSKVIGFVD